MRARVGLFDVVQFGGGSIYHRSSMWPDPNPAATATALAIASRRRSKSKSEQNGSDPEKNCNALLNVSSAAMDCQGLKPAKASSLETCAAACCSDETCTVYQFCAAGEDCDGATGTSAQCWVGKWKNCNGQRKGWKGMGHSGSDPESGGSVSVKGVRIAHNAQGKVGTQATLSLQQTAATTWHYDFCKLLVFAQIAFVKVHVTAESGFPLAVARPTENCTVTVETSTQVTGTITVEVDSSEPSPDFV